MSGAPSSDRPSSHRSDAVEDGAPHFSSYAYATDMLNVAAASLERRKAQRGQAWFAGRGPLEAWPLRDVDRILWPGLTDFIARYHDAIAAIVTYAEASHLIVEYTDPEVDGDAWQLPLTADPMDVPDVLAPAERMDLVVEGVDPW